MEIIRSILSPDNALVYLILILWGLVFRFGSIAMNIVLSIVFDQSVLGLDWRFEQMLFAIVFASQIAFSMTIRVHGWADWTIVPIKAVFAACIVGLVFYGGAIANDLHKRFIDRSGKNG